MALLDNYDNFAKFGDFIELYKEMLASSRKEPKDKHDLLRCSRLEILVDKGFNSYDSKDKIQVIKLLVESNLVPQEWIDLQVEFSGDFKTITTCSGVNSYRNFK